MKKFLIGIGVVIVGLAYFAYEGGKMNDEDVKKCNEGNRLACKAMLGQTYRYSDITNPEFESMLEDYENRK